MSSACQVLVNWQKWSCSFHFVQGGFYTWCQSNLQKWYRKDNKDNNGCKTRLFERYLWLGNKMQEKAERSNRNVVDKDGKDNIYVGCLLKDNSVTQGLECNCQRCQCRECTSFHQVSFRETHNSTFNIIPPCNLEAFTETLRFGNSD